MSKNENPSKNIMASSSVIKALTMYTLKEKLRKEKNGEVVRWDVISTKMKQSTDTQLQSHEQKWRKRHYIHACIYY